VTEVEFADMAIEVGDGTVSYIDDLGYEGFVAQHGDRCCPWSAELVDLIESRRGRGGDPCPPRRRPRRTTVSPVRASLPRMIRFSPRSRLAAAWRTTTRRRLGHRGPGDAAEG